MSDERVFQGRLLDAYALLEERLNLKLHKYEVRLDEIRREVDRWDGTPEHAVEVLNLLRWMTTLALLDEAIALEKVWADEVKRVEEAEDAS